MATKKESNPLLKALQFLNRLGDKLGLAYERHCLFQRGYIIGMNSAGMVCGIKCEYPSGFEGFAPNIAQLHSVLSRFQPEKVTQQENDSLRVESGRLKATIQCLPDLSFMFDEPRCLYFDCNKLFVDAIARCAKVAQGYGIHTHRLSGVHIGAGCAEGSNGRVLLQVWHGCNDAGECIIPREACELFAAYHLEPVGIANTGNLLIIKYADGSWIQTTLIREQYPDVGAILIYDKSESAFPPGFFDALNAIRPFLDGAEFYIDGDKIFSDLEERKSTSFDFVMDECQKLVCYNADYVEAVKDEINSYHICPESNRFYFFGPKSRGVMIGIVPNV